MFLFDWFYGILASLGLWQKEKEKEVTILFFGLDNSGKTTVFERLEQYQPQYPTSEEKIKFKAFDLGGHRIARRVLEDNCFKVDAVVYVVNACDSKRHDESRRELYVLLDDESLANVPFLILGNIIDRTCSWCGCLDSASPDHEYKLIRLKDRFRNHLYSSLGLDLPDRTTLRPYGRPVEVFTCFLDRKREYERGFKWLSQNIR